MPTVIGPFHSDSSSAHLTNELRRLLLTSRTGNTSNLIGVVNPDTGEFYLSDSLTIEEMKNFKGYLNSKSQSKAIWIPFGTVLNQQGAREIYYIDSSHVYGIQEKVKKQIERTINTCQALNNALGIEEKKREDKPKIMLFVHVAGDGTGDFSHLADFYRKFKNDKQYQDYDFIPVISCAANQFDKVKARFNELKKEFNLSENQYHFFEDPAEYNKDLSMETDSDEMENNMRRFHNNLNEGLKKDLREARQVFLISHHSFPYIEEYKAYMNCAVVRKFIGEHEAPILSGFDLDRLGPGFESKHFPEIREWIDERMGLYSEWDEDWGTRYHARGIKLREELRKDVSPLTTEQALTQIQQTNSIFVDQLLKDSGTTVNAFEAKNILIPAYYNKVNDFVKFLEFMDVQSNRSDQPTISKNPFIFLSGCEIKEENLKKLKDSNIRAVEIIRPGGDKQVIYCNTKNAKITRVVRVYSGFALTNDSYEKLYRQSKIAAVSGDNTFEMALSCQAFPYYISTNLYSKPTLEHLYKDIISKVNDYVKEQNQNGLNEGGKLKIIPESVLKDYQMYFSSFKKLKDDSLSISEYKQLNVEKMIEHWPTVVDYIFQKYNYYNKLQDIFLKNIPQPREKDPAVLPEVNPAEAALFNVVVESPAVVATPAEAPMVVEAPEVTLPTKDETPVSPQTIDDAKALSDAHVAQTGMFGHHAHITESKKPVVQPQNDNESFIKNASVTQSSYNKDRDKLSSCPIALSLGTELGKLLNEMQFQMKSFNPNEGMINQYKDNIKTIQNKLNVYFSVINNNSSNWDLVVRIDNRIDKLNKEMKKEKNAEKLNYKKQEIHVLEATQSYLQQRNQYADKGALVKAIVENPKFDHHSIFGNETKNLVNQAVKKHKKELWLEVENRKTGINDKKDEAGSSLRRRH